MSIYSVKVMVINGQYQSVPSNLLQFETREGGFNFFLILQVKF